jgi:hypothetical protein
MPIPRAKLRTRAGLDTDTATPAATTPFATSSWYLAVASTTTWMLASPAPDRRRTHDKRRPMLSNAFRKERCPSSFPVCSVITAQSRRSFETSTPTNSMERTSCSARPCALINLVHSSSSRRRPWLPSDLVQGACVRPGAPSTSQTGTSQVIFRLSWPRAPGMTRNANQIQGDVGAPGHSTTGSRSSPPSFTKGFPLECSSHPMIVDACPAVARQTGVRIKPALGAVR